jgi:hypothetical protein
MPLRYRTHEVQQDENFPHLVLFVISTLFMRLFEIPHQRLYPRSYERFYYGTRQRQCFYAIAGTACLDRGPYAGDNAGALSSAGLVGVFAILHNFTRGFWISQGLFARYRLYHI